jgi:uncharacterized protein (TIGR03083 family)
VSDKPAAPGGAFTRRGRVAAAALGETWHSLAEACWELSETEWGLPTECPGWDVKDQLSHIIGIERALMGEAAPEWSRPLGEYVRNEFAVSNEPWICVRRARPGATVRAEFVEVTEVRLAQLETYDEAGWAEVGWSPIGNLARADFMGVRVFDSWIHEQDVRRALDRPGGSGNQASAMALDQAQRVMPMVVGKRAACPDGTVVRFAITGPPGDARSFDIGVEGGRARPVADDAAPTIVLEMSSLDFARLCCGRASAQDVEAAGGISEQGDAVLGHQVLGAMNFTF